ncbi:MAG: isocitrate lyase/PEP mutase family protein [Betaproteobacteria bacterium]|jgi:carboxyvinyl-carboxyphosphonate phosphorylmutase
MSRWQARRERFRSLLSGNTCVYPGSVFDPISARIAEDLGFEVGMFAGSVASMTVLGAPDLIVLTLTEFAAQAHRICRAGDLPLLCDADHGYGNALNVMRTIEELETAGVAGLSIEDTELPSPFGSVGKPRLLSIEEGVGKMRAAVAARCDPGLVIAARTGAPSISGIADTIARAKAYAATGVDAIFLIGIKSRSDLEAVAAQVRLPLILGGAGKDIMDRDLLARHGVRVCLQGHQPFAAAVRAVHDTLKALRDGAAPDEIETAASDEMMKKFTRNDDYVRWMKDWL